MAQKNSDFQMMIGRKIVFLFILLFSALQGFAQSPLTHLSGVVVDAGTEQPLPGATLVIKRWHQQVTTSENGKFYFPSIPAGQYTLSIQKKGYQMYTTRVIVPQENMTLLTIRVQKIEQSLGEAVVRGKSAVRKTMEEAMPVMVIDMKKLRGTVSNVSDVLSKTVGVTIRSTGGVGSAARLSVRGLEGKRIGFFIDGTPLNDQSDFVGINDIPIDIISRIEIYKGIVPARFGGSAMGGAVNIVIREYPEHYADLSYVRESFHVNRLQSVFKRNLKKQGLLLGFGGVYTHALNDYTMESPYEAGKNIKRDHDLFKKWIVAGNVKAKKWWFDEVEFEPVFIDAYKQVQGVVTDIRKAYTHSRLYLMSNKLKKNDFFLSGLNMEMNTAVAFTQYGTVDTAKVWYDWEGASYPTTSPFGGELDNRFPSYGHNRKLTLIHKLNLEYQLCPQHTLNFNSVFLLANGYPSDTLKALSLGKHTDFNSYMKSWVGGLSYDFRSKDDKWLNSLTGRFYWYSMNTRHQNIYINIPVEHIRLNKKSMGVSEAVRYRLTPNYMVKLSGGYDVRIPSENELLGDGYTITPSETLLPERNYSLNAGILYDAVGRRDGLLQIELDGYYMYLKDMIRYTKGILGAQYQNFGRMRTLGVELDAKADFFPFLYGYANVTYQDLRDVRKYEEKSNIPNPTRGKRMPNIPYYMANAGLEFHKENLFGGKGQNTRVFADVRYVGEYYYDFEITQNDKRRIPGFTTLDIGCEHSFMQQRLFISAKVKNVTNARLLSEFNRPLPGRSFGIKVRYIFR